MIEFKNITKKYNGMAALDDVTFGVGTGEFVCLVGPSGAGKSTLIKLLVCEERPTSGHILVAGRDVTKLKRKELPYYRRRVGVVYQDFKLLPKKTVWENVAFALEVCDVCNEEIEVKVPKILSLVGLSEKKDNYPKELSGGEKQRASIARALVNSPKILIADEPTGNLDPRNALEIIELLSRINQAGTVVILATHNKEIVNKLKKRVVLLKNGKLISDKIQGRYVI